MTGCIGGPRDCVEVDTGLGVIRFLGVLRISKDLELTLIVEPGCPGTKSQSLGVCEGWVSRRG